MKRCAKCGVDIPDRVHPWHKCHGCGVEFCGRCGDRLIDQTMRCEGCRSGKLEVRSLL